MNAIQSILVHLDASPHSAVRLQVARAVAARFGAAVTALYAVTPVSVQMASAMVVGSANDALYALDQERLAAARKLVAAGGGEPAVQFAEAQDAPESAFVRQALYADLLVLGQRDRDQPGSGVLPDFAQSVLIASGRPALLVPYIAARPSRMETVFVAWKESREAARALTAALPWLRAAKAVHVGIAAGEADKAPLQQYLQRHGVAAECHTLVAEPAQAGEMILSMAADVGADLMVMGCYGHSRARELVLGGASRTVLDSMTVPVLMAH